MLPHGSLLACSPAPTIGARPISGSGVSAVGCITGVLCVVCLTDWVSCRRGGMAGNCCLECDWVEYSICSPVSVWVHDAGRCFSQAWFDDVEPNRFRFRAMKLSRLACALLVETSIHVVLVLLLNWLLVPLAATLVGVEWLSLTTRGSKSKSKSISFDFSCTRPPTQSTTIWINDVGKIPLWPVSVSPSIHSALICLNK